MCPSGGPESEKLWGFGGKAPELRDRPFCFELRRSFVFQTAVRTSGVVVLAEVLDDPVGLVSIQEQLHVEALIAELAVEAFPVSVLPGAAWLDVEGCNALVPQPLLQGLGDELGTVVTAQELRSARAER